ncbi:uncharacterized protein LOC136089042 [Hydra vulgaris]|uniref:Uncharacterized protein LOC136089042 n=1 Tax=Hydra vulgaris TaxID=6087 RepID=A0ABM4D8J6_HYDVU
MNPFLLTLKMKLSDLGKNASSIMISKTPIFSLNNVNIHKDILYDKLFEETNDTDLNILTQQTLEEICHSLLVVLERQSADQLPGGKYWYPSDNISKAAENVPTTNKASESDFAVLDLLIRTKPNAKIQTIQAYTMCCKNKTLDWLDKKTLDEHDSLLKKASTKFNKMKDKYKQCHLELMFEMSEKVV